MSGVPSNPGHMALVFQKMPLSLMPLSGHQQNDLCSLCSKAMVTSDRATTILARQTTCIVFKGCFQG